MNKAIMIRILLFVLTLLFVSNAKLYDTTEIKYSTEKWKPLALLKNGAYHKQFDSKGNLWFAHTNVVCFMNDSIHTIHNLELDTFIYNLHVDKNDDVWAISAMDIFLYQDSLWKKIKPAPSNIDYKEIEGIFETDSLYWFRLSNILKWDNNSGSYHEALASFDGVNWVYYPDIPFKNISLMFRDKNNDIWVTNADSLTKLFDNDTIFLAPKELEENTLKGVVVDSNNTFWFLTEDKLLTFTNDSFSYFDTPEIYSSFTDSIVLDSSGIIWFGSGSGLGRIENGTVSNMSIHDSELPYYKPSHLIVAPNGDLWFNGKGLIRYSNDEFSLFGKGYAAAKFPGIRSKVKRILMENDSTPWFITESCGVFLGTDTSWNVINPYNSPLPSYNVNDIYFANEDTIVFATDSGVSFKNGDTWEYWPGFGANSHILRDNKVSTVSYDNNGILIIGYESSGITFVDRDVYYHITNRDALFQDSFGKTEIKKLLIDNSNSAWFATKDGYLKLIDTTNYKWFGTGTDIADMLIQENSLWLATNNGLWKHDLTNDQISKFDTSNTPMISDNLTGISIDSENRIWLSANFSDSYENGGIYIIDGNNWYYTSDFNLRKPINIASAGENSVWTFDDAGNYLHRFTTDKWVALQHISKNTTPKSLLIGNDCLRLNGKFENKSIISIVSPSGKVVKKRSVGQGSKSVTLNVENIAKGIYILIIQNKFGSEKIPFKL